MLSVMVIPTPIPIEEYEAFQFTVSDAEEIQLRCNAVLSKDDPGDSKTWRMIVVDVRHEAVIARIGDWIVERAGFYQVVNPEEFHRKFTVTSSPGRSYKDPANKSNKFQANPGA